MRSLLLNAVMSQTSLTVLGGLWTWSKFIAVLVKSYSKMEYLVLASFVTKLGTRSRIAKFKMVRATTVVMMWELKRGSMNCSSFVVIHAGVMGPLRHRVKAGWAFEKDCWFANVVLTVCTVLWEWQWVYYFREITTLGYLGKSMRSLYR